MKFLPVQNVEKSQKALQTGMGRGSPTLLATQQMWLKYRFFPQRQEHWEVMWTNSCATAHLLSYCAAAGQMLHHTMLTVMVRRLHSFLAQWYQTQNWPSAALLVHCHGRPRSRDHSASEVPGDSVLCHEQLQGPMVPACLLPALKICSVDSWYYLLPQAEQSFKDAG